MKLKRKSVIVRCGADMLLPLACTFGCCVVLHGNSTPGGGFQGGVLVASAILLVFLGHGAKGMRDAFHSHFLHNSETIAEIIYVVLALLGVSAGLSFCFNFILADHLMETSILMNHAVGYHVMAGIICLVIALLNTLSPEEDPEPPTQEKDATAK